MKQIPILHITFMKLSEELDRLKNSERFKIAIIIEEARALGDLKENAEYHAAKEKQGFIEARIINLTHIITYAKIIEPKNFTHERVSFGSTVLLKDKETNKEITYSIVGVNESNPEHKLISIDSPLSKALLGKREGDSAEVILPDNCIKYSIIKIFYKDLLKMIKI